MYQPTVFYIKIQLHFGGDIHEISVPAYGGAEPTVADLMSVVERDFRVPRALQNLVFHGQDLHTRSNDPLSRFGIKNGAPIRLVGRMAPPDLIQQINSQYDPNSYQESYYTQQPPTIVTFHTSEQSLPYYHEQPQYTQNSSTGTQYDPPRPPSNRDQPPPTPNKAQPPPTPTQGQSSERSSSDQQKPPATPNSSNTK